MMQRTPLSSVLSTRPPVEVTFNWHPSCGTTTGCSLASCHRAALVRLLGPLSASTGLALGRLRSARTATMSSSGSCGSGLAT